MEKILEEIEEAARQEDAPIYCGNMEVDGYVRMSRVEDIIRKHMNDDWIPCEERLPEEPDENLEFDGKKLELYLVTVRGTKYPFRAFWNGMDFTDGWTKCKVVAWRPLPEPYRPEKGEH